MTYSDRLVARFRAKVRQGADDTCWTWTGHKTRDGYGVMSGERRGDPPLRAHRVAYELRHGPIPEGLSILHACDTPACCNPLHLRAGTNAENVADKVERDRQSRMALRGGDNPNANLTERAVADIRRMLARDGSRATSKIVLARYQITRATLHLIRHGKTWRHVTTDTLPDDPDA